MTEFTIKDKILGRPRQATYISHLSKSNMSRDKSRSDVLQDMRIQSSIAQGGWVNVLWVWVEGHDLPPDRIKNQLIEKGVIGSDKSLDVLFGNDETHLQVLAHLSDYLTGRRAVYQC